MLQRQNINEQINSRFTPASDLKIGTFVLIPNFNTQKEISKKLQPLRMNSAYNQMPPDEQSRRLTQFVIGNQQYEFNRLFYGISIGPAAFSAFMGKIFRPLILKKNAITYVDDVFLQSQTKDEMFNVLEHYHKILQNENLKAAPDKSHFF